MEKILLKAAVGLFGISFIVLFAIGATSKTALYYSLAGIVLGIILTIGWSILKHRNTDAGNGPGTGLRRRDDR